MLLPALSQSNSSFKSELVPVALIWGLAAAILAILIPLVAVAPGLIGVAIAVILTATLSLGLLYRYHPPAPLAAKHAWTLEQRVRNLEAQCTQDGFAQRRTNIDRQN